MEGPQTLSSHRSTGTTSKRQVNGSRNQFGIVGTYGSGQRGDSSTPDVSKFRPNSEAEAHFNRSFKSRPVFISRGVIFDKFFETLIYTYFTKRVGNALQCLRKLSI